MTTHGVDYLIDYYALLGVARTASPEEITLAFRKKQMEYHPDRFQGLAPELLARAEHRSNLLNTARAILADQDRRATYDSELANWKGPLSKRGEVVIDLTKPHFSLSKLLGELSVSDEVRRAAAEEQAVLHSGFDKATFEFFETQAKAPGGIPPQLKDAYLEQLRRRDIYLDLLSDFVWEAVGEVLHFDAPSLNYVDEVEETLKNAREKALRGIEEQVLLLTAGEPALLPAPDGVSGASVDAHGILAHYTAKIDEHFERQQELLKPIATEREAILKARFDNGAALAYHPNTTMYTEKVLLRINNDPKSVWLLLEFKDEGIRATSPPAGAQEELELDTLAPLRWMERGYTILTFKGVQSIEFHSQLDYVAKQHAKRLEEQRAKS